MQKTSHFLHTLKDSKIQTLSIDIGNVSAVRITSAPHIRETARFIQIKYTNQKSEKRTQLNISNNKISGEGMVIQILEQLGFEASKLLSSQELMNEFLIY